MAERSFEALPPGWGALSMIRAKRRSKSLRHARWPKYVLLAIAGAAALVFATHWTPGG